MTSTDAHYKLQPPRLTIRQTRQAESRATAESSCALKIGHLNVRSLTAHLDQVNLLLLREQLDVLCLSETWLTEAVDTSTLLFPGYIISRRDRRKKTGGGVVILYRSTLRAEQLQVPVGSSTLETPWLQITSRSTVVVGVVYRPPFRSVSACYRQPASPADAHPHTRSANIPALRRQLRRFNPRTAGGGRYPPQVFRR